MAYFRLLIVVCIVAGASAGHAATGAPSYDRTDALEISQGAIGRTLADYTLRDIDGQPFDLASLRGKPLVAACNKYDLHELPPYLSDNYA
jgi:cytochrome oxidase Cu insertion factor (SCO1/SenC/PrrC family)